MGQEEENAQRCERVGHPPIPEPVPYANLTNPQTLNLYAMVRDNPETFSDLDGHCIWDGCVVEGAIAVAAVVGAAWAVHTFVKWAKSEDAKMNSPDNKNAVDLLVHPNEHTDQNVNAQAKVIQNSTLDPTSQAKDTLNGISAGAGVVGALPGAEPTSAAEKLLGALAKGNTKAVKQTADAAAAAAGNQPATQSSQPIPPSPTPPVPPACVLGPTKC